MGQFCFFPIKTRAPSICIDKHRYGILNYSKEKYEERSWPVVARAVRGYGLAKVTVQSSCAPHAFALRGGKGHPWRHILFPAI